MRLLATGDRLSTLIARLSLAVVMFPHGAQKALGWFGGAGVGGTISGMQQTLGLPAWLTALVIAAEFLGSTALLFGFLTRIAAFGIGCVMVGAIALVHGRHGFFLSGAPGEPPGFEYHLLALGLVIVLLIEGGGKWSLDLALWHRRMGAVVPIKKHRVA